MNAMRLATTALLGAVIAVTSAFAQDIRAPAEASAWTIWDCWMERGPRILCRLESVGAMPAESAAPTPVASPARAPSGRLIARTALARAILDQPDSLRDRVISIPLYSTPASRFDAEELAGAIMCADRIQCRVAFRSPLEPSPYDARFDDPALN